MAAILFREDELKETRGQILKFQYLSHPTDVLQ